MNYRILKYGDENAPDIDWKSAQAYEKVDGSTAVLYYYCGSWHVSSEDTPDGSEEFITEVSEDKLHQLSQRYILAGNQCVDYHTILGDTLTMQLRKN